MAWCMKTRPWSCVTKRAKAPNEKQGRGRLEPEEAERRIVEATARVRDLLTFHESRTFRQLMQATDFYETELRMALRRLGCTPKTGYGTRSPVYLLPSMN